MTSRNFLEVAAGIALLCAGVGSSVFAIQRAIPKATPATVIRADSTRQAARDFTLVQLGTMRRDQFLLDRRSGRVWQAICDGKVNGADCNGSMMFDELYVSDVTPDSTTAAKYHRFLLQNRTTTP